MVEIQFGGLRSRRLAMLVALSLVVNLAWAEELLDRNGADASKQGNEQVQGANKRAKAASSRLAIPLSKGYTIGHEDVLAIHVWREPEMSRDVSVRPDGKISLPLIGDLQASGLTPPELEAKIVEGLREFVSSPEVTVIVKEIKSRKFNIVGQVNNSGTFPLVNTMTVLDAIAAAGGFTDFAKKKKIYVLRTVATGSPIRIPFNYKDVIRGKNSYQNVNLEPGDTIVVP